MYEVLFAMMNYLSRVKIIQKYPVCRNIIIFYLLLMDCCKISNKIDRYNFKIEDGVHYETLMDDIEGRDCEFFI